MVGGHFYDRKREVMTDYDYTYNLAYDHAYNGDDGPEGNRVRHAAGIAAVATAAKAEALGEFADDLLGYTIDFTSPTRTIEHIVGLARRQGHIKTLAAAHTTDLREQSKHYTGSPRPDSEGE